MRPGSVAGRADEADLRARLDPLPDAYVDPREVRVERADTAAVGDRDEQSPPARELGGVGNATRRSRADARPHRRGDVDPGVEAAAAGAETVRHYAVRGPGQRERKAPRRSEERIEGASSGDAVGAETGGALEPPERA